MATFRLFALLLILIAQLGAGLQVAPGSPCAAYCLNDRESDPFSPSSSFTNTDEIVCRDQDFSFTDAGKKFNDCVTCLNDSKYVNGSESDISWMLYNLRFATEACLFDIPQKLDSEVQLNSTCVTNSACLPLKDALASSDAMDGGDFSYCSAEGSAFVSQNLASCVSCIQHNDQQVYLSNFINGLAAACAYKPHAGTSLINGTLFSINGIEVSNPVASNNDTASPAPSSSSQGSSNRLTTSQVAGIVAGVSGVFLLAAILFIIHFIRQKKLAQQQLEAYYAYYEGMEKMVMQDGTVADYVLDCGYQQPQGPRGTQVQPTQSYPQSYSFGVQNDSVRSPSSAMSMTNTSFASLPAHPAYKPGVQSREQSRSREPTPPARVHTKQEVPIFLDTPERPTFAAEGGKRQNGSPSPVLSSRSEPRAGLAAPPIKYQSPQQQQQQLSEKQEQPKTRTAKKRKANRPADLKISSPGQGRSGHVMATRVPERPPNAQFDLQPPQSASSAIW